MSSPLLHYFDVSNTCESCICHMLNKHHMGVLKKANKNVQTRNFIYTNFSKMTLLFLPLVSNMKDFVQRPKF